MRNTIDHLSVPSIGLSTSDADHRKLLVALEVPASSNAKDEIPFLEVTRNTQNILFNGTRQDVISSLANAGFRIGEVEYGVDSGGKAHAGARVDTRSSALQGMFFEVSRNAQTYDYDNAAGLKHNPQVASAITAAENNFQSRRLDLYESYASQWYRNGGTSVINDGEMYEITKSAAKGYLNERALTDAGRRVASEGANEKQMSSPALAACNELSSSRHFQQALKGSGGDLDAAAVVVNTISQTPGYRPDQDISVVQGKHGAIVSQGQGDSALNLPVPAARPGDFERIATDMSQLQSLQQAAIQQEDAQQERRGPAV
jgi:hypothetical protein